MKYVNIQSREFTCPFSENYPTTGIVDGQEVDYYYEDDLYHCLESNRPESFYEEDVLAIVAEVPGHADGDNWWWILKLKDGRFICLEGLCSYSGWISYSGIMSEKEAKTALSAAKTAPENQDGRQIRKNLVAQVKGEQPFGLEIEDNENVTQG